jgi:hypothetical protein
MGPAVSDALLKRVNFVVHFEPRNHLFDLSPDFLGVKSDSIHIVARSHCDLFLWSLH